MNKKTFDVDYLKEEYDLPYDGYIYKELVDTSRWGEIYEIVFKHEEKFWSFSFEQGATEMQDYDDWDDESEVECMEVEEYEKTVTAWRPV